MNYRHVYHAGNHTEVFKHAVLVQLVREFHRKESAAFILDSHAGLGCYDLSSIEAQKTTEYVHGIEVVLTSTAPTLTPYLNLVRDLNPSGLVKYPGSPLLICGSMRRCDRAAFCELHPDDFQILRSLFATVPMVGVHHRDGYEATLALVPPKERRGLVFIDPPYENTDEMERLTSRILAARIKWPTGVFVAWYPIKDLNAGRYIQDVLGQYSIKKVLLTEFLRYPIDGSRLAGSGLVIINPPWKFDELLHQLCTELAGAFGDTKCCQWLVKWLSHSS